MNEIEDKDYPVAKCCEWGVWTGIAYVWSLPATLYIAIKELQVAEQQKKIQEDIEVLKNQPTFEGMDALLESINSTLAVINEQKMRTNDDKLFVIIKTVNGKEEIITEIMAKSAGDAKRSFLQKGTNAMDYDEKHISAKVKIK